MQDLSTKGLWTPCFRHIITFGVSGFQKADLNLHGGMILNAIRNDLQARIMRIRKLISIFRFKDERRKQSFLTWLIPFVW